MGKRKIRIEKKVLVPERVRSIQGGFGFIPHRFLTDGFIAQLGHSELLLYFFLSLVSDRQGLSFYSYAGICSLLELSLDEYIDARNGLIQKDLIAFDGTLFQVLELPEAVTRESKQPRCPVVARQIRLSLTEAKDGH